MGAQQASSGQGRYSQIPATTVAWNNGTARSCTVFGEITKGIFGNENEQVGNDGELTGIHTTKTGFDLSFKCIPIGTAKADALAIAADIPLFNTELTITCASDAQVAGVCYCKSASVSYTPDGDVMIDITAKKYLSAAGATLDFATVS